MNKIVMFLVLISSIFIHTGCTNQPCFRGDYTKVEGKTTDCGGVQWLENNN